MFDQDKSSHYVLGMSRMTAKAIINGQIVRRILILAIAFAVTAGHAQGPQPPTTLPALDWKCYSSFIVTFAPAGSKFQQLGLDGDNLKKPRIELHVIGNQILKVIENPVIPETRKEYAVDLSKITQDFSRSNLVYAWRDEQDFYAMVYAFNVEDRILSRTRIMKSDVRALNETQVFVCK
jgi:hypothetical protein